MTGGDPTSVFRVVSEHFRKACRAFVLLLSQDRTSFSRLKMNSGAGDSWLGKVIALQTWLPEFDSQEPNFKTRVYCQHWEAGEQVDRLGLSGQPASSWLVRTPTSKHKVNAS